MARTSKVAEPGSGLSLGDTSAGAGGLLLAAAIFVGAIVFFVAERYLLAMSLVSFAMLAYVAGPELLTLIRS